MHDSRRLEQIRRHRTRLQELYPIVKQFFLDGNSVRPDNIRLRLLPVKPGSLEEAIYFWWNLVWWSIPYEPPIGRQMRFLLWDDGHNAPFGLLGLQSPPLRWSVRDAYLGISPETRDYWANQSMSANRVGALPPYNLLLGAKMVALTICSMEVREAYRRRYCCQRTILRKRMLPARLLFVTTTSAYGKSSVYDRLSYDGRRVCTYIGETAGAGTFHVPDHIYGKMLRFLKQRGQDVCRDSFEEGPSRKLRLIDKAFDILGLAFSYHNVRRGIYFFPHARNLTAVISLNQRPLWHKTPFRNMVQYWLSRWCLPRSNRREDWKSFSTRKFAKEISPLFPKRVEAIIP